MLSVNALVMLSVNALAMLGDAVGEGIGLPLSASVATVTSISVYVPGDSAATVTSISAYVLDDSAATVTSISAYVLVIHSGGCRIS